MKTATFQFELITPCFCGGAEPERQAEIRAPSIRGQFRWWFRTLGGFASLAPMSVPDQESMIFGSIAGGEERAGKLILRIKNGPKPSTTTRDDEQFQAQVGTDRGYLAFPLKSKRDRYTGEVLEYKGKAAYDSRDDGGNPMQLPTFGLYVLWRGPVLQWDDIKALVSVFANFGSLGFRSRRALGALRVTNPVCNQTDLSVSLRRFATPNAVAAFSFSISSANEAINKLAQWLRGWRQHGRSSDHRPAPPPIPPPSSGFDYALRDHDEGLAGLGRARPNPPAARPSGRPPLGGNGESFRPAIGLPIIQFFSSLGGSRRQATLDWNATADGGRFASPILLRPHFDGTEWRALVIFLDTRQWNYAEQVHVVSGSRAGTRKVLPDLYNAMKVDAVATMSPFP